MEKTEANLLDQLTKKLEELQNQMDRFQNDIVAEPKKMTEQTASTIPEQLSRETEEHRMGLLQNEFFEELKATINSLVTDLNQMKASIGLVNQTFEFLNPSPSEKMKKFFEVANKGDAVSVRLMILAGINVDQPNPDDNDKTALHRAAQKNHQSLAETLVAAGANIEAKDNCWGLTPLHEAACFGSEEVARMLLRACANVNYQNKDGDSPLHLAVWKNKLHLVKLLIAHGANVNVVIKLGWTPLHTAAYFGFEEVAKILLEAGASKTIRDILNMTPADLAKENGRTNISKLLQDSGEEM